MINTIYIEEEILDHPRTIELIKRFANAKKITCGRYAEIFNRKSQNFRLQKKNPALILAKKYEKRPKMHIFINISLYVDDKA